MNIILEIKGENVIFSLSELSQLHRDIHCASKLAQLDPMETQEVLLLEPTPKLSLGGQDD